MKVKSQSKKPICVRTIEGSKGLSIHVFRGSMTRRTVETSPYLLLSFGGPGHTADAADLVRAVVSSVNSALLDLQGAN